MARGASGEPLSDEELMARAQAGDSEAFGELYGRYREPISRYANRIVRDSEAANDISQETFCRAFSARASFDLQARFSAWLFAIAHNLCVNELRRRQRQPSLSLNTTIRIALSDEASEDMELHETIADRGESVEQRLERKELSGLVRQATGRLSHRQREVVSLRFDRGMKYSEIRQHIGCSLGTIKSRIHHAVKRIREIVRELE